MSQNAVSAIILLHTESNLTFDVVNQAGACHTPAVVPSVPRAR